jgi:DNA helicase-2/ATP-dependent DNA helicase PcrA
MLPRCNVQGFLTATGTDAELCAVGDDDQAIYQWRGSDVANIVSFTRRRQKVKAIELLENRRSGASIVAAASEFAQSISGRLPKRMSAVRATGEPGLVSSRVSSSSMCRPSTNGQSRRRSSTP